MKKYLVVGAVFVLLIGAVLVLWRSYSNARKSIKRLESNLVVLTSDHETLIDKSGQEWSVRQALELEINEVKSTNQALLHHVDDLNLKLKRVSNASSVSTSTTDTIWDIQVVKVVDSDSVITRKFNYSDGYLALDGVMHTDLKNVSHNETLDISYTLVDTLESILYYTPKKFLFIKYGIKSTDLYTTTRNPNSRIIQSEAIVLRKRK